MDNHTLVILINSSKRNDTKAFREIVSSHQGMIYSLAFRLLRNEEDAKDIVQETFIRVWKHLSSFDIERKFSTWVYAIATNLCLDKLKSVKHNLQEASIDETLHYLISSENVEQKLINAELGAIISTLTNELTPKQKIVFTLRHLEDLEIEEIVQITGMTGDKIKSNLFLARKNIREKLEKYER
jgi:RNA polymerase sigma-70 factor (ECF subfamily)